MKSPINYPGKEPIRPIHNFYIYCMTCVLTVAFAGGCQMALSWIGQLVA